jgi:hypothetical protein
MEVVSRPRMPSMIRGYPASAEVFVPRSVSTASVAVTGDKASTMSVSARCGGVVVTDQRIPVQRALSVLRRVGRCDGSVASESVEFASRSVVSESELVASVSQSAASQSSAYRYRVVSASQSTASASARGELPSSTLPLVLKTLVRRAAAAKVSRRWRRLEDASVRSVVSASPSASNVKWRSSAASCVSSVSVLSVLRGVASRASKSSLSRSFASVPVASASCSSSSSSLHTRTLH